DVLPDEIRTGARREEPVHGTLPSGVLLERLIDERMRAGSSDLYAEVLAAMENCLLTRILKATNGNQSQAARILGITRGSLRNKLHALNIQIESVVVVEEPRPEKVEAAAVS